MNEYYNYDYRVTPSSMPRPSHTHLFMGITNMSDIGREIHNHRMVGVSSGVINVTGGHVHEIVTNTSFDDGHIHRAKTRTGLPIPVGDNKHVHLIRGITTIDDNHSHDFSFASLVE